MKYLFLTITLFFNLNLMCDEDCDEMDMDNEVATFDNVEVIKKFIPSKESFLIVKNIVRQNLFQLVKELKVEQYGFPIKNETVMMIDETSENTMLQLLDTLSYKLAEILNEQEYDFQNDPEKTLIFITDFIEKSDSYIKLLMIQMEETKEEIKENLNQIKKKHQKLIDILLFKDWKSKASDEDRKLIIKFENQIKILDKLLKIVKRAKFLINFFDWAIYSKSPIAWLLRKHIVRVKCQT